jgi:exopolysaccharide production protein ExoQ
MAPPALPLTHRAELTEHASFEGLSSRRADLQDPLGWLACFASFSMLLLISWSASRPGQSMTTLVVLLFLAPWGWILLRQPADALRGLIANWVLILLPLLAMVSAVWSDYPAISLKAGTQYLVTIFIGIWAGYCIKPRTLTTALLSALLLVTVLSILDGTREYDAFTGEYTLIGLFGSKNYFALCCSFLLLIASAVALDRSQNGIFRIVGIGGAILAAPLLVYARSVGALFVSVVTLCIVLSLRLVIRLSVRSRILLLIPLMLLTLLMILIATFDVNYVSVLSYFGKDITLTGRTLLWHYATAAISNRPVLGGGYEAYWQPGNWNAIQLWFYSYIPVKSGYHFHNTFLEVGVDLGILGIAVFVITLLSIMFRVAVAFCSERLMPEQILAITLFIFLLLRTPLEVDLFFQFQLPSILFCLIWVYLGGSRRTQARARL